MKSVRFACPEMCPIFVFCFFVFVFVFQMGPLFFWVPFLSEVESRAGWAVSAPSAALEGGKGSSSWPPSYFLPISSLCGILSGFSPPAVSSARAAGPFFLVGGLTSTTLPIVGEILFGEGRHDGLFMQTMATFRLRWGCMPPPPPRFLISLNKY